MKSILKNTREPKAQKLEAPIVLTPDQIATVAAGLALAAVDKSHTMGARPVIKSNAKIAI